MMMIRYDSCSEREPSPFVSMSLARNDRSQKEKGREKREQARQ